MTIAIALLCAAVAWRHRKFPAFAALLAATGVKAAFYSPGTDWYQGADAALLGLKIAATMEAWMLLMWPVERRTRDLITALVLAVAIGGASIVIGRWPAERIPYNGLRLVVHTMCAGALSAGLLITVLHGLLVGLRSHAVLLAVWLWGYVAVALWPVNDWDDWWQARAVFQVFTVLVLASWLALSFQPRQPRV